MRTRRITVALLGLALHAGPSAAATGTELVFTPYLWATGVDGDLQARGQDIEFSADAADVISDTDIGGSAMLEVNRGRWVNYLQLDYLAMDSGDASTPLPGVDVDAEHKTTFLTAVTGWRIDTGARSTLDLMAGVRYMRFDTRVSLQTVGNIDTDADLYDAIAVLRARLHLGGDWFFSPTMSLGAGDTNLGWELSPQFLYEGCAVEVRIGYRNLNFDFEKGDVQMDQTIHGPLIGLGMRF